MTPMESSRMQKTERPHMAAFEKFFNMYSALAAALARVKFTDFLLPLQKKQG